MQAQGQIFFDRPPPKKLPQKPEGNNSGINKQTASGQGYQEGVKEAIKESAKNDVKSTPEQGEKEGLKEETKLEKISKNKLDNLVKQSNTPLLKFSTVFPFDLFPDEICIDLNQISILTKHFMYSERQSIPFKNMVDVDVTTDFFFASLTLLYRETVANSLSTSQNSLTITFLKKEDAKKARSIIDGIIIAIKENIDLAALEIPSLSQKLELVGGRHKIQPVP
jgi:hypothetical protein